MATTVVQIQGASGTIPIAVVPNALGTTGYSQGVTLADSSGSEKGVTGNPLSATLSGALPAGANVIGAVTLSGTPAVTLSGTATVAGAVTVSNFPATQPVSGTVTANEGTPTNISTIQGPVAVAATTTSTQLLAANASRNGVTINNTSTTGTLYLLYGSGTASATNCTYVIGPGGTYEMPAKLVYKGQINGVWSVAGSGGAYGSEL